MGRIQRWIRRLGHGPSSKGTRSTGYQSVTSFQYDNDFAATRIDLPSALDLATLSTVSSPWQPFPSFKDCKYIAYFDGYLGIIYLLFFSEDAEQYVS